LQDTICTVSIKQPGQQKCVKCVVDADAVAEGELTEVVLTPQSSNFSNVGVEAFGVSMNSKSLSEPLVLCTLEDMLAVFSIGRWRDNLKSNLSFDQSNGGIFGDVSSTFL
jgi:hypothetical protein